MIRLSCLLALSACTNPSKADAPARNYVCERVALAVEGATCAPEGLTRARVTQGTTTVSCALPDNALTVVCGPLIAVEQPKRPAPQASPTEGK